MVDPFGATTRTEIESQAKVDVAQIEANAEVTTARLEADANKYAAKQRRRSNEVWANRMPLLLLMVASTGTFWLLVAYGGRVLLVLAEGGLFLQVNQYAGSASRKRAVPLLSARKRQPAARRTVPESELARYAARNGQTVSRQNGYYLLVDKRTGEVVRQFALKG